MDRERAHLRDMLVAARLAIGYVAGITRDDFEEDVQRQDAVIRRIEIIGEAAHRLTDPTRQALSDLPWREMIGMRNVMAHRYDEIDLDVVWETVPRDLPTVVTRLEQILDAPL